MWIEPKCSIFGCSKLPIMFNIHFSLALFFSFLILFLFLYLIIIENATLENATNLLNQRICVVYAVAFLHET
jgi:hypothetical protein